MGAKFDMKDALAGLDKLAGPVRDSLSRRMAVAGGRVVRDEARLRAPVNVAGHFDSQADRAPGGLQQAIYVAYNKDDSTETHVVYSVSWNSKKAFYGKFVEFGYVQKYVVRYNPYFDTFYTDKTQKLAVPKRVPAYPFLRPAYDARAEYAITVMIDTARIELPKLLAG